MPQESNDTGEPKSSRREKRICEKCNEVFLSKDLLLRHQVACGQADESPQAKTIAPTSRATLQLWLGKSLFDHSKFREKLEESLAQLNLSLEERLGCGLPDFEVLKDPQMGRSKYQLRLQERILGESEIWPDHLLAIGPAEVLRQFGTHSSLEPYSGRPAIWIPPFNEDFARARGCMYFVEPASVLTAHLGELLSRTRQG